MVPLALVGGALHLPVMLVTSAVVAADRLAASTPRRACAVTLVLTGAVMLTLRM